MLFAGSLNSSDTVSPKAEHLHFLTTLWAVSSSSVPFLCYLSNIHMLPLAVVLAPFFVHLEVLFALGYRPKMHKRINNSIGVEIARIRRLEAEKKRKSH
jgi:hypothetical protein